MVDAGPQNIMAWARVVGKFVTGSIAVDFHASVDIAGTSRGVTVENTPSFPADWDHVVTLAFETSAVL